MQRRFRNGDVRLSRVRRNSITQSLMSRKSEPEITTQLTSRALTLFTGTLKRAAISSTVSLSCEIIPMERAIAFAVTTTYDGGRQ